jgi:hypothetical protein
MTENQGILRGNKFHPSRLYDLIFSACAPSFRDNAQRTEEDAVPVKTVKSFVQKAGGNTVYQALSQEAAEETRIWDNEPFSPKR